MTTYLFQIQDDDIAAEELSCLANEDSQWIPQSSLLMVEKAFFESEGCVDDQHILDDIISSTGRTDIIPHLDEVAESMFVSDLEPEALRNLLTSRPGFEEQTIFE